MSHRVKLKSERYVIDRMPDYCGECPFYHLKAHYNPSSQSWEDISTCSLGYMWATAPDILRDFDEYGERYPKCSLEADKRIAIG